ncbi:MAG: Stf0 family sulfotransferase [Pseudomonadota bacterium]
MKKPASYMICTSPRSGSTLLCNMLKNSGIAGDPRSLFFRPSLEDWLTRLGLPQGAVNEQEGLNVVMQRALQAGRGETSVFGLRQQFPSFDFLCRKLAVLYPQTTADRDRIEHAFGPMLFVHLSRRNKLEQAVSYLKAQQTGLWHVAVDRAEWERTAPAEEPVFDAGKLKGCIATLESYDRGWDTWFRREGIRPVRIYYEDLSKAPVATLSLILRELGLDPRVVEGIAPDIRKMADATSRDWVEMFLSEQSRASSGY